VGWGTAQHGDKVVVATAALEATETVIALSECCPANARFEIGSVTKTVTATLLALIADDGLVGLDDEIGRWLAAGPNGSITLRALATHTSGLPRLAPHRVTGQLDGPIRTLP
jgi:serine-type D-Ala-D-Ala carboxypeptidase/endopeptidase